MAIQVNVRPEKSIFTQKNLTKCVLDTYPATAERIGDVAVCSMAQSAARFADGEFLGFSGNQGENNPRSTESAIF